MSDSAALKRINVYVNPDDLDRVARELGCRPSDAVRRLIDNYLLATETDEVRRMPGRAPDSVFRQDAVYALPAIPDDEHLDAEDGEPSGMSILLDTSIIIPYLGSAAYDRFVWTRLVREQVYVSAVSALELLAGSLREDQRRKSDAFIDRLDRRGRVVTPFGDEWRRAGLMLARYQNRFGHIEPSAHVNDILITLTAERLGAELATENGEHFRLWSQFLSAARRPPLLVLERREHLNT